MANGPGTVPLLAKSKTLIARNKLHFRPSGKFVLDGFDPFDIMQGATGDCWFLSSISAVAEKRPLAEKVINPTANSTDAAQDGGIYRFQFYRMGEWHDIIIDDQIPLQYCAKPENGELWVPLLEKAYAKFFGNYHNLEGGNPGWALFNLTGGLTVDVNEFKSKCANYVAALISVMAI